jgi:hypothetical protein
MKGVSPGAALVFLMAGPATNMATMAVIGKTMGRKSLFIYLGTIIGGAVLFGLLTNWLIPVDLIMGQIVHIHGDGEHEMVPKWLQIASSVLLVGSLIFGYVYERFEKSKNTITVNSKTLKVEGMTCSHCEASVTRNLSKIIGIDEVFANKNTSEVKIKGANINLSEIEKVITAIGYQYKGEI